MPRWRVLVFSCVVLLSMPAARVCLGLEQYKLIARESMARIVDGKYDKAIQTSDEYLKDHPDDLESMYVLAVAYAQLGQMERALFYVESAVAAGLPLERFVVGPRDLLQPLLENEDFKAMAAKLDTDLVHGPMLGCITDAQVRFWVRTAHETAVSVRVQEATGQVNFTATGRTDATKDFTGILSITGLQPNTRYEYEFSVAGEAKPVQGRFRTFPPPGRPAKFEMAFGGCAGYTPDHERMWNLIASKNPLAFLFLGDNVYIDNPTRQAVQQYCYYRRQSRPEYRAFIRKTPLFAIYDDHDFTVDDGWGGPDIDQPAWKVPVWKTFCNNWNNPAYGGGEKLPGCWFTFSIADVDFFMLDGRTYRVKGRRQGVDVDHPSMLGPVQKQWLLDKLKGSKATFKILASPVPWAFGSKAGRGGMDTWEGFHEEREEIFSFLTQNKVDGVILLSADRHRGDAWKIERPDDYPLYEFENARLTNIHYHPTMPAALFSYNAKCLFGQLLFDTTLADPQVTYRIVTIDDEPVYTLTLNKSQLTNARNTGY